MIIMNGFNEELFARLDKAIHQLDLKPPMHSGSEIAATIEEAPGYRHTIEGLRNITKEHLTAIRDLMMRPTVIGPGITEQVIARTAMLNGATMLYLTLGDNQRRLANYARFVKYETAQELDYLREIRSSEKIEELAGEQRIAQIDTLIEELAETVEAMTKDGVGKFPDGKELVAKAGRRQTELLIGHAKRKSNTAAAKELLNTEVLYKSTFMAASAYVHALEWPLTHNYMEGLRDLAYRPDQIITFAAVTAQMGNAEFIGLHRRPDSATANPAVKP